MITYSTHYSDGTIKTFDTCKEAVKDAYSALRWVNHYIDWRNFDDIFNDQDKVRIFRDNDPDPRYATNSGSWLLGNVGISSSLGISLCYVDTNRSYGKVIWLKEW